VGKEMRGRDQDDQARGCAKQAVVRANADSEGFAERHLWTGIGRARSGCGAALVGDRDQILNKINRYMEMGIRSFIFSGYPHLDECRLFAKYVLPRIKTCSMPQAQNRIPSLYPDTPLAGGPRT